MQVYWMYALYALAILAVLFAIKKFTPRVVAGYRAWLNKPVVTMLADVRNESKRHVDDLKGAISRIALEDDAVRTITSGIAATVLRQLPSAIGAEQQRELDKLREEVKRLQQEREWIPVVVRLPGLRMRENTIADGREMHAQVLFNPKTGKTRPMPEGQRFIDHDGRNRRIPPASDLGAPSWGRVKDDPDSIVLCGAVYTYVYDQPRHFATA